MAHEVVTADTLAADVTLNHGRLMAEPQERDKRGILVSPMARLFEARMNRALEEWSQLQHLTGQAVLLGGDSA